MKNARKIVLDSLVRVDFKKGYSNIVFDNALKGAELDSRDASFAAALFYGVLERKLTLDRVISEFSKIPLEKLSPFVLEILRMGVYQLLFMDKVPPFAALNECVALAKKSGQGHTAGFVNAVLRAVQRADKDKLMQSSELGPAERFSAPQWLVELWAEAYGEENAKGLFETSIGPAPVTARVNTARISAGKLIELLAGEGVEAIPVEGVEGALRLSGAGDVERLETYRQGLFHIQDLSSQICALCVNPRAKERVIDVCAAPGGKTFTMAELMEGKGEIVACDVRESRLSLIEKGAARLGLGNVKVMPRDGAAPKVDLEPADVVLCDVPCSGLGIIRRKPEIKERNLNPDLPGLQYKILLESAGLVKPGGRLFYSTCTLNPRENSRVVERFLSERHDFEPLMLSLPSFIKEGAGRYEITLMPHIHGTDGFYIAGLKKR